MDYEKIKSKFLDHQDKFILGGCFMLVFAIGYGVGSYYKSKFSKNETNQSNYSTKTLFKQSSKATLTKPQEITDVQEVQAAPKEQANLQNEVLGISTTTSQAKIFCKIKGNISNNRKIYHMPEGAFYKRVKAEQCFNTEPEAVAAGFIKSKN